MRGAIFASSEVLMNKNLIVLIGMCVCAIGLMLTAIPVLSMDAVRPPFERCLAVAEQEYDGAARQVLLRTRFSEYGRTGHFWAATLLVLSLIVAPRNVSISDRGYDISSSSASGLLDGALLFSN